MREIPRQEWQSFLDDFSQEHEGWLVNLEVQSDGRSQTEAEGLPLVGISADCKGSEAPAIEIMLGDRGADHVTHSVSGPSMVSVSDGVGGGEDLVIESPADGRVVAHLRASG
jgi:hypothetical protein